MKRTQIYLTEVQMKTIEQIAKRENKTLSEVIRDSIDQRIDTVSDLPNPLLQETVEHVEKYKGKFKIGKHASRDHDKIIYGI